MCHFPPVDGRTTGLLLSGGIDSCVLLGLLLAKGCRVRPIYVDSGLAWQHAERSALTKFLDALDNGNLDSLVILKMPVDDIWNDHWSLTGSGAPGLSASDEAMYLPGRNPLLLVKAVVWCRAHGVERLAAAVLRTSPFADAKPPFFGQFERAMSIALGGAIELLRPFGQLAKTDVMRLGMDLPLHLTFSCAAPELDLHCGRCNKCAERRRAFETAGLSDPTVYALEPAAI